MKSEQMLDKILEAIKEDTGASITDSTSGAEEVKNLEERLKNTIDKKLGEAVDELKAIIEKTTSAAADASEQKSEAAKDTETLKTEENNNAKDNTTEE